MPDTMSGPGDKGSFGDTRVFYSSSDLYSQLIRLELLINTPSHPSRSLSPRVDWSLAETCRGNALEGLWAYRLGRFFCAEPCAKTEIDWLHAASHSYAGVRSPTWAEICRTHTCRILGSSVVTPH